MVPDPFGFESVTENGYVLPLVSVTDGTGAANGVPPPRTDAKLAISDSSVSR